MQKLFAVLSLVLSLGVQNIQAQCTTPITPFYSTDFSTFLPTCWDEASEGVTAPTSLGSGEWAGSSSSARINLWNANTSDWLISPEFDLSAGNLELILNMNARDFSSATAFSGMGSDDSVQVFITTDAGTTWSAIATYDVNNSPTLTAQDYTLDLSSYTGTAQFGIRATEGTVDDSEDYYILVNNFTVRATSTCADPSALTTANLTTTTVDLAWTENGTATQWAIEYGPAGFTAGTGTTVVASSNPFNLTGLTSATDYEFAVRAICAVGDTSYAAPAVAFSTPCGIYTPTYTTDFTTYLPTCWNEATSGVIAPTGLGSSDWGSAAGSARVNLFNLGTSDWLISPEFDLSAGNLELIINMNATNFSPTTIFSGMGSDDSVQVFITTDAGLTWTAIATYDVNNSPTFAAQDYTFDLSSYTGTAQFGFRATEGTVDDTQDYYVYLNNFTVRAASTCADPSAPSTTTVTATTADLAWTENGTATQWAIEYGPAGFTAGTGTTVVASSNPFNLTGLTANTAYEFSVRAICAVGDTSYASTSFAFTTPCAAITPTYTTDFSTFLPACWDEAATGTIAPATLGSGDWAQSGTSTRINLYSDSKSDWLVSPDFDLSTGSWDLVLNVNATDWSPSSTFSGMGSDDSVQVFVSTDGGLNWTNIYSFNNNNLPTLTAQDYTINLSAYTGSTNIFAIRASEGTIDDSEDYYVYINNFTIQPAASCAAPSLLTTANITATTVDLGWTENGTATQWAIEYGPAGFTAGTGTTVVTSNNPFNLTGLMAATDYEFTVRAICAVGDTSAYAPSSSFSTPCAVYTPAYTTDFSSFLPACWDEATSGVTAPTGLGSGSWAQSGSAARINLYSNSKTDWLVSPEFDLSTGTWDLVLDMYMEDFSPSGAFSGMGSDDSVQVFITTDAGVTWTALATFDVNNPLTLAPQTLRYDLSSYTGTAQFAIRASEGSVNDTEDYFVYLNNFAIQAPCPPVTSTDTQTACGSYTWNGVTYTTTGMYLDTLTTTAGCDSLVTLDLTITPPITTSAVQLACDSFVWNGVTYTTSGFITDTFTTASGCDSIVTLNLRINTAVSTTVTQVACDNYTWNGVTYTTTGMYMDTLATSTGCDSIVTLDLTINTVDNTVSNVADTLMANDLTADSYAWLDCATGTVVSTQDTFVVTTSGSYQLVLNKGACIDTSACVSVVISNTATTTATSFGVQVYPNPTQGLVTLDFSLAAAADVQVQVLDINGRLVTEQNFAQVQNAEQKSLDLSNFAKGVYLIKVVQANAVQTQRVIVK